MKHLTVEAFLLIVLSFFALSQANFSKSTFFNWGSRNSAVSGDGDDLSLSLDRLSGSGMQSKKQFLFGSIEMLIKLVPGNSAGTVTAYYMSSAGDKHDEIDFEFLGNATGQPYIIHTNLYVEGEGNREQQFYPWFDPTSDFHNYTIYWNPTHIVWFVDGIPIRVFKNYEGKGVPYPRAKPMRLFASIWNADDWATRGGLVKIDWSNSPFVARFRRLRLRACRWSGPVSLVVCAADTPANWWASPANARLSYAQVGQMMWVRNNYMVYDYCKDTRRFDGVMPPECFLPQF
ncbi:hypothetical protein HPP92_003534 [Vanilla planifolia]|uniref:Xyloglucan endotransglucosylase/hydrolase n=1 Tax=Vanilla planifolia TaxID=51239 RepID=A0A835SGM6_VANPL|nr:hypothetical protein HPP92_003534 [Vanilla planifolia]